MSFERVDDLFILYIANRWYVAFEKGRGWSRGRILL